MTYASKNFTTTIDLAHHIHNKSNIFSQEKKQNQMVTLTNSTKTKKGRKCFVFQFISAEKLLMVSMVLCWVMMIIYVRKISHHQEAQLKNNVLSHGQEKHNSVHSSASVTKHTVNPIATVAYVISITSCSDERMIDGAAVLKHSIHLSSIHNPDSTSKYSYHMVAFVHPDAVKCFDPLKTLGYDVRVRDVPFDHTKIRGSKWLREHIHKGGCCGDKEFLKLHAYTLVEFPIVVHLDLDILVLQPMDELFDAMLLMNDSTSKSSYKSKLSLQFPDKDKIPDKIDAYFTRDYNLANRKIVKHVGMQGGFFIIRPSMEYFNEYLEVILEGEFPDDYKGWGGLGYGGYYGARQIQGAVSYFYDHLHAGTAVELNRCIYNTMIDEPRFPPTEGKELGICKDTYTYECQSCRKIKFSEIKVAHFTLCQKPWTCEHTNNKKILLCLDIRRFWMSVRKNLEELWLKSELISKMGYDNTSKYFPDIFQGYCTTGGHKYLPLKLPKRPLHDLTL